MVIMRPPGALGICLFLLAGAVINVAVAWTCVWVGDFGSATALELYAPLGENHHWTVYRWNLSAGTRVMSTCWRGVVGGPYNRGRPETLLPAWAGITPPDPVAPARLTTVSEAWGFPMRSLASRTGTQRTAGRKTTTTSKILRLGAVSLPGAPIFSGFAINSFLYALVVWVVGALARDMRRAVRRRLGRSATR